MPSDRRDRRRSRSGSPTSYSSSKREREGKDRGKDSRSSSSSSSSSRRRNEDKRDDERRSRNSDEGRDRDGGSRDRERNGRSRDSDKDNRERRSNESRRNKDRDGDRDKRDRRGRDRDERDRKGGRSRDRSRDGDRDRRGSRDRDEKRRDKEKDVRKGDDQRRGDEGGSESDQPEEFDDFGRMKHNRSASPPQMSAEERVRMREHRRAEKERLKLEKEKMKNSETPEQKRARRLAKKEAKRNKRNGGGAAGGDDVAGYSNMDNPFGDAQLLKKFVWEKKIDQDKEKLNLTDEQLEALDIKRLETNRLELIRVKERRAERELEIAEAEKEKARQAREKDALNTVEWEEKEEMFHIEQAKIRSEIRIEGGRAKPIDILVKYINNDVNSSDIDIHEPYLVFDGLHITDAEDLLADIDVYLGLGRDNSYWSDLKTLCEHKIEGLKRDDILKDKNASIQVRRVWEKGLNSSVGDTIRNMFDGKSSGQLIALEASITKKLSTGGENIDVSYWTELLNQIGVYMAKARLRDHHEQVLQHKLDLLRQMEENGEVDEVAMVNAEEEEEQNDIMDLDEEQEDSELDDVFSPPLFHSDDEDDGANIVNIEDLFDRLAEERVVVYERKGKGAKSKKDDSDVWVDSEKKKGMEEDEEEFKLEVSVSNEMYLWADKYRPRKPRFFNRVHTGFEWNKYNKTHYDFDNPPPKIVQGYKFNLFYPDLIDKQKAPTYSISVSPGEKDFCVLKFSAGPPYEDIAFKIVNREWEFSHKRGFRCRFERGIFQLWFHFKRDRYRR